MKRLYIIRHAKSSWKDLSLDDFDRPLNKRGQRDAPFMGKVLKDLHVKPDIILSSPARRAKTTAQIIAKKVKYDKEILFIDEIYEASAVTLHRILTKVDDENRVVFLFGHNPGLNELLEEYVDVDENIPTCGIATIEFDVKSWSEISELNAQLISFDYPKKYYL